MRRRGSAGTNSSSHKTAHRRSGSSINALKGVDSKLAQIIIDEIIDSSTPVTWEDISGQTVSYNLLFFYGIHPIMCFSIDYKKFQ